VTPGMLRSAVGRFLAVLVGIAAGTAAISLALSALFNASALRSISLGLYLVGSFLLIGGVLTGNFMRGDRDVLRHHEETPRRTIDLRHEAIEVPSAFIAIGVVLVVLGIVADRRVALF
jgi:hypothetical protein